jgi:hypothetical protein
MKMSLEENDGTVIKEKEYGRAYLTEFDVMEGAEDWWRTQFHNNTKAKLPDGKRKRFSKEAKDAYKIVDILANAFKRTMFGRFLCNKDNIAKEVQQDFDNEAENA